MARMPPGMHRDGMAEYVNSVLEKLARLAGIEPATLGFGGHNS